MTNLGSPLTGTCGLPWDNGASVATMNWLALGSSSGGPTCNNNNTCEAGESCNCADCTNGGTDDKDKCGLSNGAQMVCTKDSKNTTTTSTCQAYSDTTIRYIPNTDPRTQGWLNINGIGTAQTDNGKSVWQVNDGGNDTGDNAVIYKKFTTTEFNDFFTQGGKYSVEVKNIS